MEGMAELLATHGWDGQQLQLRQLPHDRQAADSWGRIKVIRTHVAQGPPKSPQEVMHYDKHAHLKVEPYAWCWALAAFLDSYPGAGDVLRKSAAQPQRAAQAFNDGVIRRIGTEWPLLLHHWQYFATRLDYGFDLAHERIERVVAASAALREGKCEIRADRGWQSTGFRLRRGATYLLEAQGRFQLAHEPAIWWSEANGVTLRYFQGHPLGLLLAAVVDEDRPPQGVSPLAAPRPVGDRGQFTAESDGILYLRLNDHPAELADNRGSVQVTIRSLGTDSPGRVPD
jgi:hypothetical protein